MSLDHFFETWESTDTIFIVILTVSILIILYAISLIHNKLRLIENEIQNIRKDQTVMSDELEFIAKLRNQGREV